MSSQAEPMQDESRRDREQRETKHDDTELKRSILARFFSRTEPRDHADIYLLKNLPQELRATLNGLYSRSRRSMRDTFLKRLEKGLEQQGKGLNELQLPDSSPEEALTDILVEKAGEFLRTYAIDHGHNSLREGAVLHLAVEKVSQLVTRFMQRERRASFEESSTRYISFSKEGHWRDKELMAAGEPCAGRLRPLRGSRAPTSSWPGPTFTSTDGPRRSNSRSAPTANTELNRGVCPYHPSTASLKSTKPVPPRAA